MAQYATLTNTETTDVTTLPFHFKYRIPKPEKRYSKRPTCAGSVIQESANCSTLVGSIISFKIYPACPTEYKTMYDLYTACSGDGGSVIYTFDGYWGESYDVKFLELDDTDTTSRIFTVSGEFMILCVNTEINPTNSPS